MLTETIARRYAKALFNASLSQKSQDSANRDLEEIQKAFDKEKRLYQIWASPRLYPETKKDFTKKVFPGLSSLVFHFLYLLIDKRREAILLSCIKEYHALLLDFYNQVFVEVKTAAPLSETIQAQLRESLSRKLGKKVELIPSIDSSLIGGMAIQIGDRVLDGSLKTKLQGLKEDLLRG
ncbi:MAG: ATP synthase F1 subunit delta [Firmicutes bacterium]|jgi:F-type H+-transporting ATPase subunit delta|nr:ATP synthase F1 subunit delta [Bacillota bacterium]